MMRVTEAENSAGISGVVLYNSQTSLELKQSGWDSVMRKELIRELAVHAIREDY